MTLCTGGFDETNNKCKGSASRGPPFPIPDSMDFQPITFFDIGYSNGMQLDVFLSIYNPITIAVDGGCLADALPGGSSVKFQRSDDQFSIRYLKEYLGETFVRQNNLWKECGVTPPANVGGVVDWMKLELYIYGAGGMLPDGTAMEIGTIVHVVTIDDYNIGDDFTGSIRVGSAPSKKAAATVGV